MHLIKMTVQFSTWQSTCNYNSSMKAAMASGSANTWWQKI